MSTQSSGTEFSQQRATRLPYLVRTCVRRRCELVYSLASYLFCLFSKECRESTLSYCITHICGGRESTVVEIAAYHIEPVARDFCFPVIIFANAKPPLPPIFARNRPAIVPTQQKGSAKAHVDDGAGNLAPDDSYVKEGKGLSSGTSHVGEQDSNSGGNRSHNLASLEPAQLSGAVEDNAGTPTAEDAQRLRIERAEKLHRILELFINKDSHTEGMDGTHTAAVGDKGSDESTRSGVFGTVIMDKEREDELKAARMQRVIAAHKQRSNGGLTNADNQTEAAKRTPNLNSPQTISIHASIDQEDTVAQEKHHGGKGPFSNLGMSPSDKQGTTGELTQKQIEKIKTGIRFTEKFDLDKAWDEALQASKTRLVWNITYTDELAMARKLHEKMDAYVLRKYIALLKQERELQQVPIVGNQQLMHVLRSLLKRQHIKTTKTDAEIGKLFRGAPRLFDCIPLVEEAEGSDNTTRQPYGIDEL